MEVMVILAMMLIFMGALFSALLAGLRYWKNSHLRLKAQESIREGMDTIMAEIRQSTPDPDPGTQGNPPTGYLSIDPPIDATGILYPNPNEPEGDYVEFTEPVETEYDPTQSGWSPEIPSNYQRVKYYVENGILKRHVTLFNADGTVKEEKENNVVALDGGSIDLKARYLSPTFIEVKLTATIGKFSYSITTKIKTGG